MSQAINHCPVGDLEPDWFSVQPYNRMSRCWRRLRLEDPWEGDPIVGLTLRDGDFTDVAAEVADLRQDPSLRAPTGRAGGVRVDQAHVTPGLRPAIADYWRTDPGPYSDHFGIGFSLDLDLDLVDLTGTRAYT